MADHRSAPQGSYIPKSVATPAFISGFLGDPSGATVREELVFELSLLQAVLGSPLAGVALTDPVDGVTLPSTINPAANNSNTFRLVNTTTGNIWDYNPVSNMWHGSIRVSVVVPGNNIQQYAFTGIPTGFTEAQLQDVSLEQLAGTEVLVVARWDILVSGTVTVKFVGRQVTAGNHRLHFNFKK